MVKADKKRITISLSKELDAILNAEAEKQERSKSGIINILLKEAFLNEKEERCNYK